MSASYAERLSAYPNKGQCGLPENYDTERSLSSKITKLAQLITESSYTVVLTGAGISKSAGIPDFRGPNGIWTREQQQEKKRRRGAVANNNDNSSSGGSVVQSNGDKVEQKQEAAAAATAAVNFCTAKPTLTHRALAFLMTNSSSDNHNNTAQRQNQQQTHYIQHLITQNIDGLHGKTNIPRHKLSILHGDIFTEKCIRCEYEYVRPYEIESIGLKPTGRVCTQPVANAAATADVSDGTETNCCNGKLIDTLLDWEDSLPEKDWTKSQYECGKSQLILCLGTSLRIEPAGGLCMLGTIEGFDGAVENGSIDDHVAESDVDEEKKKNKKKKGSKRKRRRTQPPKKLGYVIVNLQETPYDDNATLVIRAKVDDVMERLMIKLGYGIGWDNTDKTK